MHVINVTLMRFGEEDSCKHYVTTNNAATISECRFRYEVATQLHENAIRPTIISIDRP